MNRIEGSYQSLLARYVSFLFGMIHHIMHVLLEILLHSEIGRAHV